VFIIVLCVYKYNEYNISDMILGYFNTCFRTLLSFVGVSITGHGILNAFMYFVGTFVGSLLIGKCLIVMFDSK